MQIETIRDPAAFEALDDEWNQLLTRSASHVPFLRHEFLASWWESLGGGEWDDGELMVVTARGPEGRLVGAAPLFFHQDDGGEGTLRFLGSKEIADYLDFIAAPDELPSFLRSVMGHLTQLPEPDWQVLDLHNLLEDSPAIPILNAIAAEGAWSLTRGNPEPAPCVQLPESWDDYLAALPKKQRHEVRRKIRRAENAPRSVRWYVVETADQLVSDGEAFLALMAGDPQKAAFLTPSMRTHLKNMMAAGFQAGWLHLSFLEVDGAKAAGYLSFDFDNRIWIYNSGWDITFAELSPGWVLLSYLIQWAISQGREAVDFLRGAERYKYQFGGVDRQVYRLTLRRSG